MLRAKGGMTVTTHSSLFDRAARAIARAAAALLVLWAGAASAQVSSQYINNTSGAINASVACPTPLVRNFTVTASGTVSDVNIGILASHTWRGDIQVTLQSPSGTRVQLVNGDVNLIGGDNLNVLLDDSASQFVNTDAANGNHTTTAPPFQNTFKPNAALSAFNGSTAAGTWQLELCDLFAAADDGTFLRADLYITVPSFADLSLAMASSSATPTYGTTFTYTLTASSAATSNATATGVTVSDVLPSGATFVSSTGAGTYNNGTGVWSVGSLAPSGSASLTITATATGSVGSTVTNTAQIAASSLPDPDSTVNNGNTSEDDYASASITVGANTINCPAGSTATGSGYAASGTSSYAGQIFWLDWSCGGTALFNKGATINKSWTVGDGMAITGQITGITQDISSYTVGTWGGDTLQLLHAGLNPIGLRNNIDGTAPSFNLTLSATLNASPVSLRYVLGDAEDGSPGESLVATTSGTAWQSVESFGSISATSGSASTTISDPANAGGGTAVLETTAANLSLGVTLNGGGGTAAAFGILTPYDYSDAPLTGTSYGAANHRTLAGLKMGSAFTTETSAYDSPTASADSDDAVTLPNLYRGVATSINVAVTGPGKLSAWIDYDDDGDFGDPGEQIASSASDGGAGDSDGVANGTIRIALTPPAGAATTPTIARFRFSSNSGAASSGLAGYGEVEDYLLTVIYPSLTVSKVSSVVSDPANNSSNPKAIPGAKVRYCVLVTNTGNTSASAVQMADNLPGTTSYVAGSLRSGTNCSAASTVEDDDATGPDDNDQVGASASGSNIAGSSPNLAVGGTVALTYEVIVQ